MTSRVCRALLALALFLGAGSLTLGSARADAPAASGKPVEVGIGAVDPQIPNFADTGKTMTFSGQLRNTGPTALKGVEIEVRRTEMRARSALGSATGNGSLVRIKNPPKALDLAAGATVTWSLTPTEAELFGSKKPDAGVYAIDIDVVDSDGDFIGGQRTYVVWRPLGVDTAKPARVALLWPVVGQPGLTGGKTPNSAAAPYVADPATEQQFAAGGRLDRVLRDGQLFPVNWILDPDLLYTANDLSGAYFVSADGKPKSQGSDGSNAKNWFTSAQALFPSATNCWNLPYADPDLTSLSRTPTGQAVLAQALKVRPPALTGGCRQPKTVDWPANGQADGTTLAAVHTANTAAGAGDQITLLSSNVVSSWKSAHVSLGAQSPNTVVYDTYLSGVFTAKQPSLSDPGVLAGQEWLAQTALMAQDSTDRILVAAPPRDFDPPQKLVDAIAAVGKLASTDQWVGLQDLGKVLNDPANPAPSSPLTTKTDTPNLSADVVKAASDSQKLYQALHSVMEPGRAVDGAVPYRPVATWWRTHQGDAPYSKAVHDTVVDEHGLIEIDAQPQLTMSGKSGFVPVTIKNNTNSTVRVYLKAQSLRMQLKVAENQGLWTLSSGQQLTVHIKAEGEGNGQQVGLTATLYTCPDFASNCKYYPTYPADLFTSIDDNGAATIQVKISRIGIIALGLLIGSGVLLVALIGLRVYRAKRAQHAPAQDTMAS